MKTRYLFELSKDYKNLSIEEVKKVLSSEGFNYKIDEQSKNFLIVNTKKISDNDLKNLSRRLSQVFVIDKFLFSSPTNIVDLANNAKKNTIGEKGTIAVKYRNRSTEIDSQSIVNVLANVYTKNREVNLTNPDIGIRALITDKRIFVGIKKTEINRSIFEKRKVQDRPFFSPVTLHPKLARALVNISGVKKNEVLLDPFCGTGGFLIEAGLMGFKIVGSDVEEKMIKGCRKTLNFYGIKNYDLFICDIGQIDKHLKDVDRIVTDLPYGKAATTKGEDRFLLYKRAFQKFYRVLKPGGVAVVGVPDKKIVDIGKKYLDFQKMFTFRVHKSLTRYFLVFKKKQP